MGMIGAWCRGICRHEGGQLSEQEKARFVENINLANDAQTGGMALYSRRADEPLQKCSDPNGGTNMRKIQRRDFLKAMGLATAALGLTACGGSGAASASSVSSAPASSSSAPSASAQPESAVDKAAPAGAL